MRPSKASIVFAVDTMGSANERMCSASAASSGAFASAFILRKTSVNETAGAAGMTMGGSPGVSAAMGGVMVSLESSAGVMILKNASSLSSFNPASSVLAALL